MPAPEEHYATGRRKESVARVWIKPGSRCGWGRMVAALWRTIRWALADGASPFAATSREVDGMNSGKPQRGETRRQP